MIFSVNHSIVYLADQNDTVYYGIFDLQNSLPLCTYVGYFPLQPVSMFSMSDSKFINYTSVPESRKINIYVRVFADTLFIDEMDLHVARQILK